MSDDGVQPHEMDTPHEFDDNTAEALLTGQHHGVEPRLADLVGDMRIAYTSQSPAVSAELAAVLAAPAPALAAAPPSSRRFERMRSPLIAKIGAAAASLFAATGGLAVAHALPAPMQDAVSHLGVGSPAHHSERASALDTTTTTMADPTATTMPEDTTVPADPTPTSAEPSDESTGAVSGHDGQGDTACDSKDREGADSTDSTDSTTVASTVAPVAVPAASCVPSTDTTVPESSGDKPDDNGGTASTVPASDDNGDGSTTVSSVPSSDGSGDQSTTPTTAASSGGSGGDGGSGSGDGGSGSSQGN